MRAARARASAALTCASGARTLILGLILGCIDAGSSEPASAPAAESSTGPAIPEFRTLSVGFQKFQPSDGFVVWIDEVAFDVERIGCD